MNSPSTITLSTDDPSSELTIWLIGLLRGIKLKSDNAKFLNELFEHKMLAVKASENVVRLLPPLIVKEKEIDEAISIIEKVCEKLK